MLDKKEVESFSKFHRATEEEMEFFEYLYKKERRYRVAIFILVLMNAVQALLSRM